MICTGVPVLPGQWHNSGLNFMQDNRWLQFLDHIHIIAHYWIHMKSLFAKTDKCHPKIELFTPPCILYYLVFNVKVFFWQKPTITSMFTAKTYAILQKPINATFAGWLIQINPEMALVGFCKWTLHITTKEIPITLYVTIELMIAYKPSIMSIATHGCPIS